MMTREKSAAFLSLAICCVGPLASAFAEGPCVSGLPAGQRPGPYAAIVAVGPNRGQLHCFICETADKPAVVVFARRMSDPLGKLVQGLDKAVLANKTAELRSWVTFLTDDQPALDPQVVKWGKQHGISNVSLAVFEDTDGPPAYKLARDADVTVLLYVKQKVVKNFAFRAGELDDKKAAEVLKAIPAITTAK
jgi:hypothetical protein